MAVLGIDFGTSNSAAAYLDATGQLQMVQLDGSRAEMPTALFFAQETNQVLFGAVAMQEYLAGSEGRLLRALKSLLGSRLMDEYTAVNGQSMRYFDMVVLFLKEVKRRAEQQAQQTFTQAMIGRPVHFVDDDPQRDALAQATLARAAQEAGFGVVNFQFEPIAAALDYEQRIERETTVLVVDIGGGTSDFTVIRLHPKSNEQADRSTDILATTGVHIGGTDFDRLLDLSVVMPLLGYGHIGKGGRPVPNSVFFDLSTWHLIHQAYSRKALHFAKELWTDYADLRLHTRLMDVLENQWGHRILAAVEQAKIACSVTNQDAPVGLDFMEPDQQPVVAVHNMKAVLQALIAQVVQSALACVHASGLQQVDSIYLTGGSSALTPLVEALRQTMPAVELLYGNRFSGVAAGLAVAGNVCVKE